MSGAGTLATSQFWGSTVSALVKATEGRVFAAVAFSANASARYLMLFNGPLAPVAGQLPFVQVLIGAAANSQQALGPEVFGTDGLRFPLGIAWGVSTTRGSYTAATAADHDLTLVYI